MVQFRPFLSVLRVASVMLLCGFNRGSASPSSSDTGALKECPEGVGSIALGKIDLEIIFLEPTTVEDPNFGAFLNEDRSRRFKYFVKEVSRGFRKKAAILKISVNNKNTDDLSCLYDPPCVGRKSISRSCVHQTSQAVRQMLLAAALTPKYLENFKKRRTPETQGRLRAAFSAVVGLFQRHGQRHPRMTGGDGGRFAATSKNDNLTVRVIVIFLEDYGCGIPGSSKFKGDGTDTCASQFPTRSQVEKILNEAEMGLVLVTVQGRRTAYVGFCFDKHTFFAYPAPLAIAKNKPPTYKYDKATDKLPEFVRNKAIAIACKQFPDLVVRPRAKSMGARRASMSQFSKTEKGSPVDRTKQRLSRHHDNT